MSSEVENNPTVTLDCPIIAVACSQLALLVHIKILLFDSNYFSGTSFPAELPTHLTTLASLFY